MEEDIHVSTDTQGNVAVTVEPQKQSPAPAAQTTVAPKKTPQNYGVHGRPLK